MNLFAIVTCLFLTLGIQPVYNVVTGKDGWVEPEKDGRKNPEFENLQNQLPQPAEVQKMLEKLEKEMPSKNQHSDTSGMTPSGTLKLLAVRKGLNSPPEGIYSSETKWTRILVSLREQKATVERAVWRKFEDTVEECKLLDDVPFWAQLLYCAKYASVYLTQEGWAHLYPGKKPDLAYTQRYVEGRSIMDPVTYD